MTEIPSPSSLDRGQALHLAEALAASRSEFERMAHARALANLGPAAAAAAAPCLAGLLAAREPGPASAAAFVLCEIGPAALGYCPDLPQRLAQQLGHWDGEVRHWTATALGRIAPESADAWPKLRELLGDPDEGVCLAAIYALEAMGPAAGESIEDLTGLLHRGSSRLRHAAVRAILAAASTPHQAAAVLEKALDTPAGSSALAAATGLLMLQDPARSPAALAVFEHALKDPKPNSRRAALEAAQLLHALPAPLIWLIGQRLSQESDDALRAEAAYLLQRWAAHCASITEFLLAALHDPEPRVRQAAALTLAAMPETRGNTEVASVLAEHLNDPDSQVQAAVIPAYACAEPNTHQGTAVLCDALQSPAANVRLAAIDALAARPPSPVALSAIKACLADSEGKVRVKAAQALVLSYEAAEVGLSALERELCAGGLATQALALQALAGIESIPDKLRQTLGALLEAGHPALRPTVEETLRRLDAD